MSNILPTKITRDPAEAQEQKSNIMPGNGKMGRGYDVTGEYCSATSVKRAIIDLGDPTKSHDNAPYHTSELVDVIPAKSGAATDVSGSSLREYAKNFSAKFDVKGENMMFSAELDLSFATHKKEITTTSFVKHDLNLFYCKLLLSTPSHLRDKMTSEAQDDFSPEPKGLPADKLVEYYGTHYLSEIIIGGRASYCCTAETTDFETGTDMAAAARVSALMSSGQIEGGATVEQTTAAKTMTAKSHRVARVMGGDPRLVDGIFSQGTFDAWKNSVPDNLQFCDCTNGLVRISELVEDPTRKAEIERAIDAKLGGYKLPPEPDVAMVFAFNVTVPQPKHKKLSRWFYSMRPDGAPAGFVKMDGRGFYALTEPRPGTVPIYRQDASNPTRFRFSRSEELNTGGWANAVLAFHAWPAENATKEPCRRIIECLPDTNAIAKISGYHYTNNEGAPGGWQHNPAGDFFVPDV